jgi:uncharacterized protein Yka (UPF0111/DUF47 family)
MKKFNEEQMEFIKENYPEEVDELVNYEIDRSLIYYSDIEEYVRQFSNIVDVLNGNYTMDDLYSDVYNDILENEFDDIAEEIYDNLDDEEKQEIDELDD